MASKVRLKYNRAAADMVVHDITRDGVKRAAERLETRSRNYLQRAGRIHTGRLLASFKHWPVTNSPRTIRYRIGSDQASNVYQNFGTRAHGPVKAKYLRFVPKGQVKAVYTKWVRGVKPSRHMERALKSLKVQDFW